MTYPHPGTEAWESYKEDDTMIEVKLFHANWCGPCRIMKPIIEQISKEDSSVKVDIINVDEDPEATSEAGVNVIPTIIFCKDDRHIHSHIGVMPKGEIEGRISELRKND